MARSVLRICLLIALSWPGLATAQSEVAPVVRPAQVADNIALLDQTTLRLNPLNGRQTVKVLFDPKLTTTPVVSNEADGPGFAYLRRLAAQGRIAGLAGVIYDNRDRDHSSLPHRHFPQLTRSRYADDLKKLRLDYGLGSRLTFSAITFGNSSTAYGGVRGRSLTRDAMTRFSGPDRAYQNYVSDHIYVYPEHKDHDAADLFPANWPYTFTSQGSSYSDRGIMNAIAMILAALPADTRDRLDQLNLVAPTVQMVFRRGQANVRSRAAYLSGLAHPTVFPKTVLAPERMMALAGSIRPDTIPPMVRLRVKKESFTDAAGLARRSEKLFDTPSAIARIWRSTRAQQSIEVSAAATKDPNGRPLTYSWVLLRGDPKRVRIVPDGDTARITLDWHDPYPISRMSQRLTRRVDIAVFAHNGHHDSAPAFISVDFPTHQRRIYETGPDERPRLNRLNYDALSESIYFDPTLYWSAPWEDRMTYDAAGQLTGWNRHRKGVAPVRFRADGSRADGTVLSYKITANKQKWPLLQAVSEKQLTKGISEQ